MKVHDTETISNCFIYCDVDVDSREITTFRINRFRNDLYKLIHHLTLIKTSNDYLVGYNSLNFDSQILQYIIDNYEYWGDLNGEEIARKIFSKSQYVINECKFPEIPEWKLYNKHIDLYRIWHFDNKNRRTRLKDLQVALKWHRVQDMPLPFNQDLMKEEDIELVVEYCINDILSTLEFYIRSTKQIQLRQQLSQRFGLNLLNANDPKLGSEIFAKLIADRTGRRIKDVKEGRTYRAKINLGELVLDYINFDDPLLNQVLSNVKKTTITSTKGAFEYSFKFNNVPFDLKLGGIHACTRSGVYEAKNGQRIKDIDVASFYPNLAINNRFYPEHLGEVFCDINEQLFNDRKTIPKSDPTNYAYKIMLNGVYGKSNDENSFFYDPRYTMQITINGQLLLVMLVERLGKLGAKVLQANTDGVTIMYDEDKEDSILSACNSWMDLTKLELEYVDYSKMIIRDVNNYIAVDSEGKLKYKGAFEVFDSGREDFKDWHKDPSFPIISRAVSEYFINSVSVEETIDNCNDIFQFCGRAKFGDDSYGETRCFVSVDSEMYKAIERQQKTTRYYVSQGGKEFVKVYYKGTESVINRGSLVTIYNNHHNGTIPAINKSFYIEKAKREIESVEGETTNQLSLF